MKSENIAALSTAPGVGGVAVIRISGDDPLRVLKEMFRPTGGRKVKDFVPYMMYTGEIDCGGFTDFGMAVSFRAPKSYTGENMVEIHCHGGPAIVRGILRRTYELGCRPADKGEFTKRAFLNGKLSLSSCEGLIDMINSESEGEVKAGYSLYRGRLTREIRDLQDKLKQALARVEVALDFPDEAVEEVDRQEILALLTSVGQRLGALSSTYSEGKKVINGVNVAIVGRPNVGKSSLLNALLSFDRAIVSPEAGTTRDTVEATLVLDGIRYRLSDTAGIRPDASGIEKQGISRSLAALASADVAIAVFDGSVPLGPEDAEIIAATQNKPCITVVNKCDLPVRCEAQGLLVSAATGEGVDRLKQELKTAAFSGKVDLSGDCIVEERHFYVINEANRQIAAALGSLKTMPLDAVAVDISACWQILGEITGETASESIIEEIFSKFCVGK